MANAIFYEVRELAMATMFEDLKAGLDEVDAFLAGSRSGYKVSVPSEIDVKSIREGLHMTQARFSEAFGFSLDAVKHWEGGRRTPEASARAFLTVIAKNPKAVISALHSPGNGPKAVPSDRGSVQRGRKSAKPSKPTTIQH
jgi:putative transcriptional regulator